MRAGAGDTEAGQFRSNLMLVVAQPVLRGVGGSTLHIGKAFIVGGRREVVAHVTSPENVAPHPTRITEARVYGVQT